VVVTPTLLVATLITTRQPVQVSAAVAALGAGAMPSVGIAAGDFVAIATASFRSSSTTQ
jgi:hypothetical protein